MAISSFSSKAFFALIFAIFLAEYPTPVLAGQLIPSKTWHGRCWSKGSCNLHCRNEEHAIFGACKGLWHRKCYCYHLISDLPVYMTMKNTSMPHRLLRNWRPRHRLWGKEDIFALIHSILTSHRQISSIISNTFISSLNLFF